MTLPAKKIVIIGGGPSGCSAAAFALRNGFSDVTILEASPTLGGMHTDIAINGLHFDLGAFFFWNNHTILNLFPNLKDVLVYAESAKHLSLTNQYNLDRYPLTLGSFLKENGVISTVTDICRMLLYRIFRSADQCANVDELLTYYMGPFYIKTGLKNYIRRLYNMDPKNIDVEFGNRRVGGVISKFRFKNMLQAIFSKNWNHFKKFEIIPDTWARPESGFAKMYEIIEAHLIAADCKILRGQRVVKIDTHSKIIETSTGLNLTYDYLLTSQELGQVSKFTNVPFDCLLKYKSLCSLFYEIPASAIEDCFVLFNFSPVGRWKRATFHSNYYNRVKDPRDSSRHYFVVESMPDDNVQDDGDLALQLDRDFKKTMLNTRWGESFAEAVLLGHRITKNAYPIFDADFDREKILAFVARMQEQDIYLIGRQGTFEHVSSSDAAGQAIRAIETIAAKEKQEAFQALARFDLGIA